MNIQSENISSNQELPIQDPDLQEFGRTLHNLRKLVETKIQLNKIFHSIHEKLNRGAPYDVVMNSLFQILDGVIPYDRLGIALLEDQDKRFRLIWMSSKLPITFLEKDYSAPVEGSSLKLIIDSGKPRVLNDLVEYLHTHPNSESTKLALKDGIRSSLTCPIIVDGKPKGVIFFSSAKEGTYKEAHEQIFCEIAEGISLVIDHSLMKKTISDSVAKEKVFRSTIHDLANPLSVIQGTLQMIERKEWFQQLGGGSKKAFNTLKRNSETMVKIINDLIYSKDKKPQERPLKKSMITLENFLANVKNDGEAMAQMKNISFNMEIGNYLPEKAVFDAEALKGAIGNLIANAVKFSEKGTQITLKADFDETPKRLEFVVQDQGIGIKESELPKIFTRGHTSSKPTAGEGSSGQGLVNVKKAVEAHKGKVYAQSKLGEGSEFGFWIPYEEK